MAISLSKTKKAIEKPTQGIETQESITAITTMSMSVAMSTARAMIMSMSMSMAMSVIF